jgi:demethylspheroidene O-methyltransferase
MAMIEASSRPAPAGERLGDRWRRLRNGVIGSPGFQRWAARFPFTRPVARQRARALFDLTAGFVYSQTAYACVRSGLLEHLAEGPAPVAAIARRAELPPAGAERLLRAAVALGLAERAGDGRYALGQQGAALLGAPGVAAMIEHHQLLYADLADPLALLRRGGGGGALAGYWPYASGREGEAAPYSALMSASQAMVAAQVLDAYPLARHRRLLDVGGGDGTFLRAVAARAPGLELALFDLPPVAAAARARFAADGLTVGVSGGSFLDDPLPEGADAISLVRVVHDHDDAAVITLLRAARRALPPGGVLLLAEPMAGTRGAEPMAAYFDLYLLAMGSGRPRTSGELRAMLRAAGFTRARQVATSMPLIAQLIVASA